MKIAVTGKGGTGKTTIAFHLSRIYAKKNLNVIAVDADSSLNLASYFGHEDQKPISSIRKLVDKRARISDVLVNLNPDVHDLIDEYSAPIAENLKLLLLGGVNKAGTGCLCPENSLLRALMQELVLERNEIVILDMEAGLEIMSRGTLRGIDAILVVTEPNLGSISVTKKLLEFSKELGIKNSYVIANKVDEEQLGYLSKSFDVFHALPFSPAVQKSSMDTKSEPESDGFQKSLGELADKLLKNIK